MSKGTKDKGVLTKSDGLRGKEIAVGICGGIAGVEIVKVIRELRRHGAEIHPFMTTAATAFITELSVSWAADRAAVVQLDAGVRHLEPFDGVLLAPLTLNTLSKCALGLSDNAVTLLVASQLGHGTPIMAAPTMNAALAAHPLYRGYQGRLKEWGVVFMESDLEEDRYKMPSPLTISELALRVFNKKEGKR